MKGLDFKPEVLSKEYVEKHGVLYDDSFYQDDYKIEALYDKAPERGGKPFTGLLYELYNDTLIYYQFFTDGFGDGEYVRFYETGDIASYCIMKKDSLRQTSYTWYRNGKLKSFREVDENLNCINAVRYDESGNIAFMVEDGVSVVNTT